jgi:hypothetical protein
MINKQIKNLLIIFFLFSLIIFSLITIIKKTGGLRVIAQDLRIISCQPQLGKKTYTEKIKNISLGFFNYLKKGCNHEVLKITIKRNDLDIIKKIRERAISENILINSRYVPAKITWNGKAYSAKLKLKGDLKGHWKDPKQWSFKISLKNGNSIMGLKEFSITKFEERQFPGNQIIAKNLASNSILTPNFFSSRVSINNINWGPMLIEEQYSNAFLELKEYKDSPMVRFTNGSKSTIERYLAGYLKKKNLNIKTSSYLSNPRKFEINIYNKQNYMKSSSNIDLISILKSLNEITKSKNYPINRIEKYINIKKFAKVFATNLIYGDFHSIKQENMKFYINPYNLKVEPMPTDHIANHQSFENKIELENNIKNYSSPFFLSLFKLKSFEEIFFIELEIAQKNIKKNKDLNRICDRYIKACLDNINSTNFYKNYNLIKSINFSALDKKNFPLIKNNDEKKDLKKIYKDLYFIKNDLYSRLYDDGDLYIYNMSPFRIEIKEIKLKKSSYLNLNDKKCKNSKIKINKIIDPYNGFDFFEKLNLNQKICLYQNIEIEYLREDGFKNKVKNFAENQNFKPDNLLKNDDINIFPQFIKSNKNKYVIPTGNWVIEKPLIFPKGNSLEIKAGANISFKENSYIFLNEGNLIISGKEKNKVNLIPFKKSWGGIYVLNSKKSSIINYTNIDSVNEFKHNAIDLSGGINFYNSSVNISNSLFSNSFSEDAINIIKSSFEITNSKFARIKSDAIDSDFSDGKIYNSKFDTVGGDAVDISGSKIKLFNSEFKNIIDKSVSTGEKSIIILSNIKITKSGFGIVSKDGSLVKGENISILNSKKADIAAFQKKSFYSGAKINLEKVKSENKMIIQDGSEAIINNINIKSEKFDSDILYY